MEGPGLCPVAEAISEPVDINEMKLGRGYGN